MTDLRDRTHHLSQENEMLFQQVTTLRQYYERFNQEQQALTDEANKKLANFAAL